MMYRTAALFGIFLIAGPAAARPGLAAEGDVRPPAEQRFADPKVSEVPDFQRHVLPAMGRMGCNGRACHGSFQGQGGFRLSLFGYDFKADHEALLAKDEDRVVVDATEASLILQKPSLGVPHKGGKRMALDSWTYRLISNWIDGGAKPASGSDHFARLEVVPAEILFRADGEKVPLKVTAHWADGSAEDVTCLTRFRTNDESIAEVDENGVVISKGRGDTHIVAFYDNGVTPVSVIRPVADRLNPNHPESAPTTIDRLVLTKLNKLGIVPSETCTDEDFLRRLSLDLTGTLPTPDEVLAFVKDTDSKKRAKKIDELLGRPTYAAWWTNKLCDTLGNTPRNFQGMPVNDLMARRWYEWLYRRVAENTPYDKLVAGMVLATSRKPDQSFDDFSKEESAYYHKDNAADYADKETSTYFWARRNFRQPEEKALGFSYAFLGVRLECAQCHKHPFDQWTQNDFKRFQAFFETIQYRASPEYGRELKQLLDAKGLDPKKGNVNVQRELTNLLNEGEVVPWQELIIRKPAPSRNKDAKNAKSSQASRVPSARVLGGDEVDLSAVNDPRDPLMDWLRDKENPYFARAFVNRVWANHFGVGIVSPPDDMNLANPPSNAALLTYLAEEFIKHDFDMKWLHRTILNSEAYQRSWHPNDTNGLDERNFSRAIVRRLPAEVLLDAAAQASAGDKALSEVATNVEARSFGPVGGAGAGRRGNDYAGRVFGRAARDTNCDCSRSDEPNLLQAIYLENDPELLALLDRSGGWINETVSRLRKDQSEAKREADARIKQVEDRLTAARKKNKKDDAAIQRLESRLAELRKANRDAGATPRSFDAAQLDELVTQAYLRTVNRRPSASEQASVRTFFESNADPAVGLRGLLWALLNTKEFITNH